jgi:hypothetical protein
MIPRAVRWRGALLTDRSYYDDKAFFDTRPYDVDFSAVRNWAFAEAGWVTMSPSQLSPEFVLCGINLHEVEEPPAEVEGVTRLREETVVYGFCGWFDAELSPSVILDTSPGAPPTHWRQLVFPLPRPLAVHSEEDIVVRVRPVRFEGRSEHWHWSISTSRETVDWDDFSYRAHIVRKT